MPHLGNRTAAGLSVILSAALGFGTNILTSHWSWGLAVGCVLFLVAMVWLAARAPAPAPVPSVGRTSVEVVAKRGSRLTDNTVKGVAGAQLNLSADHHATVNKTTANADGADLSVTADDATLDGNEITSA